MNKEITIGKKTLKMASNALTPILYRQIFKKDFLKEITGLIGLKDKKAKDYTEQDINDVASRSEAFGRLAFVMAKQSELEKASELVKLTEIDYFEWLSNFDAQSFTNASTMTEILKLWKGNAEDSQVEAKN